MNRLFDEAKLLVSPRREIPPRGPLYLYLAQKSYVETWVGGGSVPIYPARKYLGERDGIQTPDEISQVSITGAPDGIRPEHIAFGNGGPPTGIRFVNAIGARVQNIGIEGVAIERKLVRDVTISHYEEDAYVLCFSRTLDASIAARMVDEKKRPKLACVEIIDPSTFFKYVDRQLGGGGEMGVIGYVTDLKRNHFTKSVLDLWQDEFRFLWRLPDKGVRWIDISPGTARLVWELV
jgi:hypothetical protein